MSTTELIKEAVRGIRTVRTNMNVPISKKARVFVVSESAAIRDVFENGKVFFTSLAKASDVTVQKNPEGISEDALSVQLADATIYIPLEELVDIDKEIERLENEKVRLQGELKRVDGMLSNEKFLAKAPEAKVQEEKDKKDKYLKMMEQVEGQLLKLKK